jgi:6-phosphogluconolactonase
MWTPDVRVYPDLEALSREAAAGLVDVVASTISAGRQVSLVLVGGNTPRALYRLLAAKHRHQIAWSRVHLFWGDERYVPPDDPHSNFRMARETLIEKVPIPPDNVHPMPTHLPVPDDAARAYETLLRTHFPGGRSRFDLALLGLGIDGHTASLFPNALAVDEHECWAVAARAPVEPAQRLTLTLPALNDAVRVWFLVAGSDKARALRLAVAEHSDPRHCPASGVRPTEGTVTWWTDRRAAAMLRQGDAS